MQVEVLLFDLGGVLVEWDGTTPLVEHTGGRIDRETARQFWLTSPWVGRQDLGQCTLEDFADGAIAELGLDFTREAFIEAYLGWVKGVFPGTHALLDQLKGRYRLATLTNNNAAHFGRIASELALGQYFDEVFASHELHMKKPDAEIYRYVTEKLGVAPQRIAFFDDNIECIEPARAIGWQAFHTIGLTQVEDALRTIGAL
ncbi:HAD family hydrolase [Paludibacterium purpuratum]|uniref:Putative hydrolase of the HAD superfamily n=1 Tax=Paludibacterium purpuratum TaxID=1144873 RepID=A0A4R7BBJ7_9NEIS|nr:HAD family phosphatase [Paludibacterium purpuratum]TDR82278.1 putative hydrolase of the HAD superfamily [Paludibacterium purpuratum]